jgi:hypothetical protein
VENPLAQKILSGAFAKGDLIEAALQGEEIVFGKKVRQ